jgi:hypothetical protein
MAKRGTTLDERVDLEEFLRLVAEATPMGKIAEHFGVHRVSLFRWLKADEERHRQYEAAKEASAEALVDRASDLIETAEPETTAEVSWAKEKVGYWKWLAGKRSAEYDDRRAHLNVEGNFDFGLSYLAALRELGSSDNYPTQPGQIEDADFELLEEKKESWEPERKEERLGQLPKRK